MSVTDRSDCTKSPVPIRSIIDNATCIATSVRRLPLRPTADDAFASRIPSSGVLLEDLTATKMPNTQPVTVERTRMNASSRASRFRAAGGSGKLRIKLIPAIATATPEIPPSRASTMLSVSCCRARRPRVAPSASRIASSRRRATERASSRFATFAHATTSVIAATSASQSERSAEADRAGPRAGISEAGSTESIGADFG